jgi:hypothetical protein
MLGNIKPTRHLIGAAAAGALRAWWAKPYACIYGSDLARRRPPPPSLTALSVLWIQQTLSLRHLQLRLDACSCLYIRDQQLSIGLRARQLEL